MVESVGRPVNVLARPGAPPVAELGRIGVKRISVGGAFAFNAIGALVEAAQELSEQGTYGFAEAGRHRGSRRAVGVQAVAGSAR